MKNSSVNQVIRKTLKWPISIAARRLLGTITYVQTTEPVLALTFDDGPSPKYTPRLLEVLDQYQARATFFCVGQFAARYPEVIRQAAKAGHVIGNHTWDHSSFPLLTVGERSAQLRKCAEALKPYGSRLFRPPYGQQSFASRLDLLRKGYQVVGWTRDAGDWRLTKAGEILEQVLPGVQPGRIITFHDQIVTAQSSIYFNREPTIEAVRLLLERFSGRYRFVTVPELARHGRVVREKRFPDADPSWLNKLIKEGNVPGRQYPLTQIKHGSQRFFKEELKSEDSRAKEGVF